MMANMVNESRRSRAHLDIPLLILVFGLAAFGVLAVSVATFSTASQAEDTLLNYIVSSYYGFRQAIFFFVAFIVVFVIAYSRMSFCAGAPRCSTSLPAPCWALR